VLDLVQKKNWKTEKYYIEKMSNSLIKILLPFNYEPIEENLLDS